MPNKDMLSTPMRTARDRRQLNYKQKLFQLLEKTLFLPLNYLKLIITEQQRLFSNLKGPIHRQSYHITSGYAI